MTRAHRFFFAVVLLLLPALARATDNPFAQGQEALDKHDYDRAIALKPDYAEAYGNRGKVLRDLRRLDEALASSASCQSSRPSAGSHRASC